MDSTSIDAVGDPGSEIVAAPASALPPVALPIVPDSIAEEITIAAFEAVPDSSPETDSARSPPADFTSLPFVLPPSDTPPGTASSSPSSMSPSTASPPTSPTIPILAAHMPPTTSALDGLSLQPSIEGEALLGKADIDDLVLEQETLFSVVKMAETLKTGTTLKKAMILLEVQQMIDHCFEDTIKVLVPVICLNVPDWDPDLQIAAADALLDLVHKTVPPDTAKMISAASFRVVKNATVDTIYESWGEVMVAVIPFVSWNDDELVRVLALLDAHANRTSEVSRKLAARVIGSMSLCVKPEEVETLILPRAIALSKDEDLEVKGMSTESLAFIGATLDPQIVERRIWVEFERLLQDDNARIRAATLRSICRILESNRQKEHPYRIFANYLHEVFHDFCFFACESAAQDQRMVNDDAYLLLEIFSEVFGEYLLTAIQKLDDDSIRIAHRAFLTMATCNGPVVRRHCAYNLPGVSHVFPDHLRKELVTIFEFLSRDPDAETRWNLAAGVHESVKALSMCDQTDVLLRGAVSILHDDNPLVRMNALEHFSDVVIVVYDFDPEHAPVNLSTVFLHLNVLAEGNWRTQNMLANQLKSCAHKIPSKLLRVSALPTIYRMAEESTFLVRKSCMEAVAHILHHLFSKDQEEICNRFRIEWAQGGVFWMRIAYLECAFLALRLFSREKFRKLFVRHVLKLCGDPVSNVRLRIATEIHSLAYACQDMSEFRDAIDLLQSDEDVDIVECMKDIDTRMDRFLKEGFKEKKQLPDVVEVSGVVFDSQTNGIAQGAELERSEERSVATWDKRDADLICEEDAVEKRRLHELRIEADQRERDRAKSLEHMSTRVNVIGAKKVSNVSSQAMSPPAADIGPRSPSVNSPGVLSAGEVEAKREKTTKERDKDKPPYHHKLRRGSEPERDRRTEDNKVSAAISDAGEPGEDTSNSSSFRSNSELKRKSTWKKFAAALRISKKS